MNSEERRILWVYTDDVDRTKSTYAERFGNLKNVDDIMYTQLNNSTTISGNRRNDIVNVAVINDLDKLSHILLIELIKLIRSEYINLIYTNNIHQFNRCYTSMVGPMIICGRHPASEKDFFDEIQELFNIKNINIAIISDETSYMNHLISDLIKNVDDKGKVDGKSDFYDTNVCMELDSNMPKLVQQWVYNVWYGKKPNLSLSGEMNNNFRNDVNAKLYKVVSVNVNNERLITYYFINPYKNANLSDCISNFDVLLIDMETHYSVLNFGHAIDDLTIIPFIKSQIEFITDTSAILNIINNMITYSRGNYLANHSGELYNDYHSEDISHSIKVTEESIEIDNINILKSITPFEN